MSRSNCCCCRPDRGQSSTAQGNLPLICLIPRNDGTLGSIKPNAISESMRPPTQDNSSSDFELLTEDYIRKHFNIPKRALYLDPFRRPLISFPPGNEKTKYFNMARKQKINQQILDGKLDPSEAISSPSVFPYASQVGKKDKEDDDEEIIYILQLPDLEYDCPIHKTKERTPRFIWRSSKDTQESVESGPKEGKGPLNRPRPDVISRLVDFDRESQW